MIACTTCFPVEDKDGSLTAATRHHFEGKKATCDPLGVSGTPNAQWPSDGSVWIMRLYFIDASSTCLLDIPISFSVSLVMPRKPSLLSFVSTCLRNPLCFNITRNLSVVCRASSSGFDVWFSASGLYVLYDVTYVFFSSFPPADPFDYPQHRQVHS